MAYSSLKECVLDLERHAHLIRIREEVDPYLEMAEIHRRVNRAGGPALFYEKVKGSPFPAVSNLYGTLERCRFIFRQTLDRVKKIVVLKAQPAQCFKNPFRFWDVPFALFHAWPRRVGGGPVFAKRTTISQLPQIQCWPQDGGPFMLLPQVYTEDQDHPGILHSNLGMYRLQMSGNQYQENKVIGLHYQIRRDIGIHHSIALRRKESLRVSVFVGGPPAHAFAAVMYLPEGMAEVQFAGALAGRRFRYAVRDGFKISAEADFCITGWVDPEKTLPEGPFGDHLGYYSLKHNFPFLKVESVYHRQDAVWPFTVVGRPPQEDSRFGKLIHEIAGPIIPKEIPGIKAVHAVDAAGVHPLLLAIGSERYAPYQEERRPQEILTLANALLGYGPCSLAKYLMIAAGEDQPRLDIENVREFFRHLLERIDWQKDLHFQTRTSMDTLDYSGTGLNTGSKVVMAAAGRKRRDLASRWPGGFSLPEGFGSPRLVMPGVAVIEAPAFRDYESGVQQAEVFSKYFELTKNEDSLPLMVLVDDSEFAAASLDNFLWTAFTRSNPSHDIYGVHSFTEFKHWGCRGSLILDSRMKPHHAPPLIEDSRVTKRVEALAAQGHSLHGII